MNVSGFSSQIKSYEDMVQQFAEENLAGLDGVTESEYKVVWLANKCALHHPNMFIQVYVQDQKNYRTLLFRAKDFMAQFSRKRNVSRKSIRIPTPGELAGIAPWGYNEDGSYCGAGELLAFGPEGLEESPAKEALVDFVIRHRTTGQNIYNVMEYHSRIHMAKSFTVAVYSGVDNTGERAPKYSAVYLNKGYRPIDFFRELSYLLAVFVQPA